MSSGVTLVSKVSNVLFYLSIALCGPPCGDGHPQVVQFLKTS